MRLGVPAGVGDINVDGYDDIAIGVDVPSGTDPGDWVAIVLVGPDRAEKGVFCVEDVSALLPLDLSQTGRVNVLCGRRMGDSDSDADVDFADFAAFHDVFGVAP